MDGVPRQLKQFIDDKYSILDILAVDKNGRKFNIEVQTQMDKHFTNRSLFYWSRIYGSQIEEGSSYSLLRPVVSINLLNYKLFPKSPKKHKCYVLIDEENRSEILTDHLILHYIQIPQKLPKTTSSLLEKWLVFKEEGKENEAMKTLFGEDAILREAHKKYEKFTRDQDLFYAALSREKFVRDQISREESAREEGIELGILQEKQIILKKLPSRKFQLSNDHLVHIDSCTNSEKLDRALDKILEADTAEEVLEILQ